jgi:hypothetical protein
MPQEEKKYFQISLLQRKLVGKSSKKKIEDPKKD